jgi:hypothetical protein
MTRHPFHILLGVVILVLALGGWARAQTIPDPSFETAGYPANQNITPDTPFSVNGWSFGSVGASGSTLVGSEKWTTPGSNGNNAQHHINMVTNSPSTGSHVYLETTMTGLVNGQTYALTFDAKREGAIGIMGVFLEGDTTTPVASYTLSTSYETFTVIFTATGASELLRFQDNSSLAGASNWDLDALTLVSFGPVPGPPLAVTLPATLVMPTTAQLNGLVDPVGISTDIHFEYSTDPGLAGAISTPPQNIGLLTNDVQVSAAVANLVPRTNYYFRVVATSAGGTTTGNILGFYTGVINWGGSGTDASSGNLDGSIIPPSGTQTFTNVNGQSYYIVVTTSNLSGVGQASYFGSPDWWFAGGGPTSGYGTVTFQFFDSLTNLPYPLTGVDFRLLDAEENERFRGFGYWDQNNNFVSIDYADIRLAFSDTPLYHATDNSIENDTPFGGGDQLDKWIELNLADLPITGFTLQAHRQKASAGSVIMSNIVTPWAPWRTTNFGGPPYPASADDFADPDGDGNANILEYFFATDPNVADVPNPLQTSVVSNRLTLTFPRYAGAMDTTATVQGADGPGGPWTDLARSTNGDPFVALVGGVPVSETGSLPIFSVQVGDQYLTTDPGHPTRFLRLQVVH